MIIQNDVLERIEYAKVAYYNDKKIADYLKKCTLYNKVTGEVKNLRYDSEWYDRQSFLYYTFRVDYLNKYCIGNGMTPIFITLTLPSEYHYTSKKYNRKILVEDGYRKLITMYRDIYNNFKVNRKRVEGLKFVRVIEPHKSYVCHLHAIVYVNDEYKNKFIEHVKRVIRKNRLKQTDIRVLDKADYAVTYLHKYVQKSLDGNMVVKGWRKHHNIKRMVTMSNLGIGLTRNIFKRITAFIPFDKNNNKCYFEQILDNLFITRIQKNYKGDILKIERFGSPDSLFHAHEILIKYRKKNIGNVEMFSELDNDYDCELNDSLDNKHYYRLEDLIIFDDNLNELYNKRDIKFYYKTEKPDYKVFENVVVYDYEHEEPIRYVEINYS